MPSTEYDLVYLRAGLQVLQEYLLSAEIYWTIGVSPPKGEPPYPQLTLGWLLLANERLKARRSSSGSQPEVDRLGATLQALLSQWRVASEKKAYQEFRSRLNLWRDFIGDYRSDPQSHFDRYPYEVSRRVILHLLQPFCLDVQPAELELLRGLDQVLRTALIPGQFIWESDLAGGFPPQAYWYLYGTLPR